MTGLKRRDVVRLNISRTYEDLYEKALKSMWDGTKMYEIGGAMRVQAELQDLIGQRGPLTQTRLWEIANSCFAHLQTRR